MYYLGIDAGASTLKLVAVSADGEIIASGVSRHAGNIANAFGEAIARLDDCVAEQCGGVFVCGSAAPLFLKANPHVGFIDDIPALVSGMQVLAPQAASIIQIGAHSSEAIVLQDDGAPRYARGKDCAAGSGIFLESQMERLGLPMQEYSRMVAKATRVPRLSGRCAVFAKTDVIHCQQEGEPIENILLGLCYALARSFKASVVYEVGVVAPVAFAGGVAANEGVVLAMRDVLKLGDDELLVDPRFEFASALGAAQAACDAAGSGDVAAVGASAEGAAAAPVAPATQAASAGASCCGMAHAACAPFDVASLPAQLMAAAATESSELPRLRPLPFEPDAGDGGAGVSFDASVASQGADPSPSAPMPVYLGIDVGSTSTDAVLIDKCGNVVDAQYTRTGGDPRLATSRVLDSIRRRVGDNVRIVASATTGSGRVVAGELAGADLVCNEITAQARAAAAVDPLATSVFEIGGQDSKFVSLKGGHVADFQMNKICAAGTGSFIEEQASYLGIPLSDFGDAAISAKAPVDLGERCTVFVETAVRTALAEGARIEDIAAGLCLSVVRNYLHRVVGSKPVGARVVLQGGVAYNKGIVSAFRQLSDAQVVVSPWFAVSGAVGAALLAKDAAERAGQTAARQAGAAVPIGGKSSGGAKLTGDEPIEERLLGGAKLPGGAAMPMGATPDSPMSSDALSSGSLSNLAVPSRSSASASLRGASMAVPGKPADRRDPLESPHVFYAKTEELYLKGYDGRIDPAKKTVGVPRCLMLHKLFPMANVFFRELGFNVQLSDATDEEAVLLSQSVAASDVCLPVKLLHGHMEQLVQRGVDCIFVPSVQTIRHVKSTVAHNYACVYLQSGPQLAARALELDKRGVQLLSPVLKMDFGQPAMAEAMLSVGRQLDKPARDVALAMLSGSQAVAEFTSATEKLGDQLLSRLSANDRAFVIITRNYGIADPVLNMGVPDLLLDRGQHVLTLSHLHAHDIDLSADYPDLYWPFAQHIVSGARIVARDPRLFAIYLTSHGCGPDSMIEHLFKREMGDKPYLQLEVDEHASAVGVTTRIEAFLDAVSRYGEAAQPVQAPGVGAGAGAVSNGGTAVHAESFSDDACTADAGDAPVENAAGSCGERAACAAASSCGCNDGPCSGNRVLQEVPAEKLSAMQLKLPSVGVHGPVVAAWLRGKGCSIEEVRLNGSVLEHARAGLMEGEYYSFAALLGASAVAAQVDTAEAGKKSLLLLPSNEGGDADGQFARIVDTELESFGCEGYEIAAPKFEQYPFALNDPRGLFRCLAAADICQAAPIGIRESLLATVLDALVSSDEKSCFGDDALLALADSARAACSGIRAGSAADGRVLGGCLGESPVRSQKRVSLIGEWMLVHADGLVGGAWQRIEAKGVRIDRMPLSEALCFLWTDAAASLLEPAPGKVVDHEKAQTMSDFVEWAAGLLRAVSARLGEASPFASDVQALRAIADADIRSLIGGFGRYRYAKTKHILADGGAVIAPSSLYENTGIAVRQLLGSSGRMLNLSFDGSLDSSIDERISAFLHYL